MHAPSPPLILAICSWLLALPWLVRLLEAAICLPHVPMLLTPHFDRMPNGEPTLTIIVPARNEAHGIRACLASLIAQDYPNLRILAVDDRSTDATGAIMDELAAHHPSRLLALHIAELPDGWLGKPHAMASAARLAIAQHHPDLLLFTDGDILFAPDILRRALVAAQEAGAAHMVTFPTTITRTSGESMLLAFLQVLGLFAVRPWRSQAPGKRDAIGVGAFNLVRTGVYLQLGGFDATPMEIVEDLAFGRRVKAAGLRQLVAYAPGAVNVHWAPGLVGVLHGMTKNLFAVFRFNPALLLAATGGLTLFWICPWLMLACAPTRPAAVVILAALAGFYLLVSRKSLLSPAWFLTAPVAAALIIYSMLRSMFITLRDGGVTWRGTFYPLRALRDNKAKTQLR